MIVEICIADANCKQFVITCVVHAHVRRAFHVLAGQGWVALLTDVGMHVACRGHNQLRQGLCVAFVGVCDLTQTSCDGKLHSWCVAQQHVRYCVCRWCSRNAHACMGKNTLLAIASSTIKYADLNDQRDADADFKDQRC